MTVLSNPDERLENWEELRQKIKPTGLLIGNGASLAVWENFAYESLFEVAKNGIESNRLKDEDIEIFELLKTKNFEQVLSSISIAIQVNNVFKLDTSKINECYDRVKNALIESVRSKHIPWRQLTDDKLSLINNELLQYKFVYSTNYDLLVYWAMMQNIEEFIDFFFEITQSGEGNLFDITNTQLYRDKTVVLFLHGCLHLIRTLDGKTYKRIASERENLLELFGNPFCPDNDSSSGRAATPLFISEGTSEQKLESIRHSDYLSFSYSKFANHVGPLCIFGHSLSDSDKHIVDAINRSKIESIAISVRSGNNDHIIQIKAGAIKNFQGKKIYFYDSASHPLGSPDLFVMDKTMFIEAHF